MKTMLTMLAVLLALAGCASSSTATNPEAQSQCQGTWDARTGTCIGR